MEKHLKEYLPFYIGCKIIYDDDCTWGNPSLRTDTITPNLLADIMFFEMYHFKIAIRPLSDLTDEEAAMFDNELWSFNYSFQSRHFSPEQFKYLLKQRFDVFELIEEGLAIDITKIKI